MDETDNFTLPAGMDEAQAIAELEAEFERELKRNQAAAALMKEREIEAKAAKIR